MAAGQEQALFCAPESTPLPVGGTDAAAIACLPLRIVCPASRYSQPQIFHCILTEKIPAAVPVCRIRDAAGPEAGCRFPPSRDTAGSPFSLGFSRTADDRIRLSRVSLPVIFRPGQDPL